MGTYLVRRLLQTIIVIFGVTLLTFLSLHLAGDPTLLYVSERASEEEIAETRAKLGFDQPLYVQYAKFVAGAATGDFGNSLRTRTPAFELVLERLPATIELTLFAMFIAIFLAIPIGILSAMNRGTSLDGGVMLFAMFGQSMPSFWLGIMLILIVGLRLRWLPISGHVPVIQPMLDGDWAEAITIVGFEFGFLLSGVVVIETVFSWPGVGRLVFNSINQRDIPVVQSAVIFFSLLFVFLNLLVDLVYTILDPRIRLN
jgi:peptide/nickel transport system permease protein